MGNLKQKLYVWLRRSERIFKTDMVYILKGGFWLNGTQFLSVLTGFLLTVAFANLLSQTNYGTYEYIISLYGLLGSLTLSGLGGAVTRAVARGHEGEFRRALKINFRWDLILSAFCLVGAFYYYLHHNIVLTSALVIITLFLPLLDTWELYPSYLAGRKDFKRSSLFGLVRIVATSAFIFLTLLFTKEPILLVISYFFSNTLVTFLITRWVLRKYKPNSHLDPETIILAKHTSLMNNVGSFFDQLDNVIVFHLLGPVSLALYNFAIAIPEYLRGVIKNIGVLAMPKYAQADKEEIQRNLVRKSLQIAVLGVIMYGLYAVLSPYFFKLFLPRYLPSIPYSRIYALMLIMPGVLPATFLSSQMAIKEKYLLAFWTIPEGIVSYFVVLHFGLWGLVIAKVISKYLAVFVTFILAARV